MLDVCEITIARHSVVVRLNHLVYPRGQFNYAKRQTNPMATTTDNLAEVKAGLVECADMSIGYLIRHNSKPDDAGEIFQIACVKALQKHEQFRAGTNFRNWFFSILFSCRSDFYRRENRARRDRINVESLEELAEAIGIDLSDVADEERIVALRKCLEHENPFRKAVHLRYFDKLQHKEIALRLDIPEGTASTRIFRGIKLLRQCIEGSLKP